jgi:hypothetical protein
MSPRRPGTTRGGLRGRRTPGRPGLCSRPMRSSGPAAHHMDRCTVEARKRLPVKPVRFVAIAGAGQVGPGAGHTGAAPGRRALAAVAPGGRPAGERSPGESPPAQGRAPRPLGLAAGVPKRSAGPVGPVVIALSVEALAPMTMAVAGPAVVVVVVVAVVDAAGAGRVDGPWGPDRGAVRRSRRTYPPRRSRMTGIVASSSPSHGRAEGHVRCPPEGCSEFYHFAL